MTHQTGYQILVADAIAAAGIEDLRQVAQVDVRPEIKAEGLRSVIGDYHALIVRGRTRVTAGVVKAGTRLKVVGRAGVGVDNVDLAACQRHGVIVVNSPLAASVAVAELVLALMLALARRVHYGDSAMKKGAWPKKELTGIELHGKTLGLIAIGRIGTEVAKRAAILGMRVMAYDPYLSEETIRERNVEPATLQDVLSQADYVSIHTPLTDGTWHMIDADAITAMKDGVRIVCAARGGVIDEHALLAALETHKVAGAALDVFETEPPGASPLVRHPSVIATPHIGAETKEAQQRAGVAIAEEVIAALSGKPLRWRVMA